MKRLLKINFWRCAWMFPHLLPLVLLICLLIHNLPPPHDKALLFLSSMSIQRMFPNLSGWKKKICLGCSPTLACRASWVAHSARPSPRISLQHPPSLLHIWYWGHVSLHWQERLLLEGGLKGLQTDPDRRCLAADVAVWYVTVLKSGEEMWGETEVETCDWLWLRVQVSVQFSMRMCVAKGILRWPKMKG